MSSAPPRPLSPDEQRQLAAGQHERLAATLLAGGEHHLAAWVLEQIWEFDGALTAYLSADRPLDALRVALELDNPDRLELALSALERAHAGGAVALEPAVALLKRRGHHIEAARLMAREANDPVARAESLRRGGALLEAARTLQEAGMPREALDVLEVNIRAGEAPLGAMLAPRYALAAQLSWSLGDAESAARCAQRALRCGVEIEGTPRTSIIRLLARALDALGHDLAAQVALQGIPSNTPREASETPARGRYHLRETISAYYAGAAYGAIDRVTLQDVEVHLLLADHQEMIRGGDTAEGELRDVLEAFATRARAAARIGHPAIRPILRFDPAVGLLVLPRAEGPTLRSLIRPPGMRQAPARARALICFLLEGLVRAHARGVVHGSILPSQLVCDAAGRPLLGPFGAEQLAGLVATRTGTLEELVSITSPEQRAGGVATTASDVYSVAAIFLALLAGDISAPRQDGPDGELERVAAALSEQPEDRPSAAALLRALRVRAPDARELQPDDVHASSSSATWARIEDAGLAAIGVTITLGPSWPDELIDALLAADHPWMQPVLDRRGRELVLAGWPDGTRRLDARGDGEFAQLVPLRVLESLPDALASAIRTNMSAETWVLTPANQWMLALDELLRR